MRFTRLSLLAGLLCGATSASANEHAAPPAAEGEGGGEAKAAPPREQKEFTDKTVKLNALAAKLEESRKQFADAVKEKDEAPTAAAKVPFLKQLVEIAKQRDKDQLEYDKLKSELAQRYPNQGAHVNRHIEEHGGEGHAESAPTSADHVAGGASLDDLLDQTKTLIDRKYAPFKPPTGAASSRAPASAGHPARPARLRLEK